MDVNFGVVPAISMSIVQDKIQDGAQAGSGDQQTPPVSQDNFLQKLQNSGSVNGTPVKPNNCNGVGNPDCTGNDKGHCNGVGNPNCNGGGNGWEW